MKESCPAGSSSSEVGSVGRIGDYCEGLRVLLHRWDYSDSALKLVQSGYKLNNMP